MHLQSTRNEFLRLRVHGLSLAAIGRRLHVSKPTLIAWNRQSQAEIAARVLEEKQRVTDEVASSATQQLADLKRKYQGLKQELFSRAMREIPTSQIETLAGEFRQQIDQLECASGGTSSASPNIPPHEPLTRPAATLSPSDLSRRSFRAKADGERAGRGARPTVQGRNARIDSVDSLPTTVRTNTILSPSPSPSASI